MVGGVKVVTHTSIIMTFRIQTDEIVFTYLFTRRVVSVT